MSRPDTSLEIYRVVERIGREELARPISSLAWSGLAAGVAISFSVFGKAFLVRALPEAPWAILVAGFGYTVGFVIVILGRLQLFTEDTLTVVLPTFRRFTAVKLARMLRLWGVVFAANMAGTAAVAAVTVFGGLQTTATLDAILAIARHDFAAKSATATFLHGLPAGFLIASLVWILPRAGGGGIWAIVLLTYVIAVGDFSHVVAGAVEVWTLLFAGEVGLGRAVGGLLLPALAGNVVGGTGLFALLAYEQVRGEFEGAGG